MIKKFETIICDVCRKEHSVPSQTYGGRSVGCGWFSLLKRGYMPQITIDICSLECLQKYAEENAQRHKGYEQGKK